MLKVSAVFAGITYGLVRSDKLEKVVAARAKAGGKHSVDILTLFVAPPITPLTSLLCIFPRHSSYVL